MLTELCLVMSTQIKSLHNTLTERERKRKCDRKRMRKILVAKGGWSEELFPLNLPALPSPTVPHSRRKPCEIEANKVLINCSIFLSNLSHSLPLILLQRTLDLLIQFLDPLDTDHQYPHNLIRTNR